MKWMITTLEAVTGVGMTGGCSRTICSSVALNIARRWTLPDDMWKLSVTSSFIAADMVRVQALHTTNEEIVVAKLASSVFSRSQAC